MYMFINAHYKNETYILFSIYYMNNKTFIIILRIYILNYTEYNPL